MNVTRPRSRLAGYSKSGHIWLNNAVPVHMRGRLRLHETTEYALRKHGLGQHDAHRLALKAEHHGLSLHQIEQYEGRLGAVARWHPSHHNKLLLKRLKS